jgi:hypothetical protein
MMWCKGHDGSLEIVESNLDLFMASSQYRQSVLYVVHFTLLANFLANAAVLNSWISVKFGTVSLYSNV